MNITNRNERSVEQWSKHGQGRSAHCKREQSGMGTSQPCAMTETETAAMATQPPSATLRHYNLERGERVVRTAVLARWEPITWFNKHMKKPTAAQHSQR